MDDFAEWGVDEFGGVGDLGVIEISVGDIVGVGKIEDFDEGFFDDAGALAVGTGWVHGGEIEDGHAPKNSDGED